MTSYVSRSPVFASLCEDFLASPTFQSLADESRKLWERELRAAGALDKLGSYRLRDIGAAEISDYLDSLMGRPGKQAASLSAMRAMERWGLTRRLMRHPFCYGVKTERPQGGHKPWTDQQVSVAIGRARADISRAVVLGAYTGQRGSDLVRIGWSDVHTIRGRQWIRLRQKKTGREFMVPIMADLAAHMRTWERRPEPFLTRREARPLAMGTQHSLEGRPWTREALTAAWTYERDRNPALREHRDQDLHLHGLRSYACIRLYLAGATTREVAQTVGMSEEMVGRYTRLSSQLDEAAAAIERLERRR
jgi:integrase